MNIGPGPPVPIFSQALVFPVFCKGFKEPPPILPISFEADLIGDAIILLHGALVRSNFPGFIPQNPEFHDFLDHWKCHRPLGAHMFDFGSAKFLQRNTREIRLIRNS